MKTKAYSIFLSVLAFAVALVGCSENAQHSKDVDADSQAKDRIIDSLKVEIDQLRISADKSKPIDFCLAEKMVNRYRTSVGSNYLLAPGSQKLESFHVPKADLLYFIGNGVDQLDADGIRFHIAQAQTTAGDVYHTFVLMGTDEVVVGTDTLYNDIWTCKLYDFVRPCPTFCDNSRISGSRFGDQLTLDCDSNKPCDD